MIRHIAKHAFWCYLCIEGTTIYNILLDMKKLLCALMGMSITLVSCANSDNTTAETVKPVVRVSQTINQDDFIQAAEQTVNGVVSVKSFASPRQRYSNGYNGDMEGDPLFEFFFGRPRSQQQPRQQPRNQQQQPQQQIGLGSGVIISEDGYVVTNNHVIADAERLEVTLNDNRNFEATVIGADPETDLALIKIEAPDLHVIPMGDSEKLHVGEWVLAVGNPFGFTSTVTSGIVSAKARNISHSTGSPASGGIESYIQTDAAVNRGNSGGALVNLKGELVGINTAIYSQTGTYAGCSFAIPTSIVQKVVSDIKSFGTVQKAYLGIMFGELTPELIAEKKIEGTTSGIYVGEVVERSAAAEAGLEVGDVVVSVGGKPTLSTAQMQEAITHFSPGDKVSIEYYRKGKKHTTEATLRNNRGDTGLTKAHNASSLGAVLSPLDSDTARSLHIRGGVAVSQIDSDGKLAAAGVREGYIILSVNNERVSKPEQIESIIKAVDASGSVTDKVLFLTGIYPDGKAAYYAVPLTEE